MADEFYVTTEEGFFNKDKQIETGYDKNNLPVYRMVTVKGKVVSFKEADELLKNKKYQNRADYLSYLDMIIKHSKKEEVIVPKKEFVQETKNEENMDIEYISDEELRQAATNERVMK